MKRAMLYAFLFASLGSMLLACVSDTDKRKAEDEKQTDKKEGKCKKDPISGETTCKL